MRMPDPAIDDDAAEADAVTKGRGSKAFWTMLKKLHFWLLMASLIPGCQNVNFFFVPLISGGQVCNAAFLKVFPTVFPHCNPTLRRSQIW